MCSLTLIFLALISPPAEAAGFKIRAIAAFIEVSDRKLESEVAEAVSFLNAARREFERKGYAVQSIRIATQPFAAWTRVSDPLALARRLDGLAGRHGFEPSIGPAIIGDDFADRAIDLAVDSILGTSSIHTTVAVASSGSVQGRALRAAAAIIKRLAERSKGGIANFRFAAIASCPAGIPFFPAAYNDSGSRKFAIALESAGLVAESAAKSNSLASATAAIARALEAAAAGVEKLARDLASRHKWSYLGIDLSPAPLKEASIGRAVELLSGSPFGSAGTLAACAAITRALSLVRVKRCGYSGLMLPVQEDSLLAQRAAEGRLRLDTLLAASAVSGTGLDVVPLPGDTSQQEIEKLLLDVAWLSVKLGKPLSARLLLVPGRGAGEQTEFDDPFLVNTRIMRLEKE